MRYFFSIILTLTVTMPIISQDDPAKLLRGVVKNSVGSTISDAEIQVVTLSNEIYNCTSGSNGKFECRVKENENFTVTVRADGYNILRRNFSITQDLSKEFEFQLLPAGLRETVTVSTSRTETLLSETPASVVSISKERILTSASPAADDILRQTVGFSLFRRSNSRNANPTTQGTSLRGINASGASRSQVLLGGIPLNDPFGGWVQWSRVSTIATEKIEVLRGGSSGLYGSDSLGGTINIFPRKVPESRNYFVAGEVFGGSQRTFSGSVFFGFNNRSWSLDLTASNFQTKGYQPIEKDARGSIDDFANSHNSAFSVRVSKQLAGESNAFIKADYFGEARNNGTPVQKNRTHLRQFSAGSDLDVSNLIDTLTDPVFKIRGYGGTQVFDQTFSAIDGDRNGESIVRLQRVPAQSVGLNIQFSAAYRSQTLLGGLEISDIRGASNETGYFGGNAVSAIGAGGRERNYGAYFQDIFRIGGRIVVAGNLRFDSWKNSRALSSVLRFSTGQVTTDVFADRKESAFSPGGSVLFYPAERFSVYVNVSRNFRAPTLNELYRGFRVGDVVTEPNEDLRAEKSNNFEGGANFNANDLSVRASFYWTEVSNAVSNVTITAAPDLITRRRENAGKIRIRGLEIETEKRFRQFNFAVGYLFADAVVIDPATAGSSADLRIPQVPVHQFTFQAGYQNPHGWDLSFQGRGASSQFDDDLNAFRLEPYFQLDAFAGKRLKDDLRIFAGIENVFNSRYSIGKTPVRTVSSPLNFRIGLRWN
ncbi:MAG: TonB-dependent receptor [Pyrinomonadaceae bacterium]